MNRKRLYIAVDFDGTIVKNEWPNIGKPRWGSIPVLRWMKQRGHVLILNTCREQRRLLYEVEVKRGKHSEKLLVCCSLLWEAKMMLEEDYEIYFDYYNKNAPERIELFGGDCRKISADWYIDDLAGFLGWWSVPLIVWWLERKRRKSRRNREDE
jgi:hypothetical protein